MLETAVSAAYEDCDRCSFMIRFYLKLYMSGCVFQEEG